MYLQTIHMYHLCMQHVCVYRSVSWVGGGAYMYYTYVSYVSTLYHDVSTPAPQDTCIQVYLACIWHVSWRSSGFDPNTSRIRVIRSHSFGIPAFQGHSGGRATIHTDTHPIHTRCISIRWCHAPVTDTFTIHTRYTSIHMYATAVSLQGFSRLLPP